MECCTTKGKVIKFFKDIEQDQENLIPLNEMCNLGTNDTGLSGGVVWIGTKNNSTWSKN